MKGSRTAANILAILAVLTAILLRVIFSPIPTRLGLYRWIAETHPRLTGFTPAFHYGVEWGYSFDELYRNDLAGQTALVTGGNSGIGYEACLALSRLGASVTMACRNFQKCQDAAERIRSDARARGRVNTMTVDVSSLESVRDFSKQYLEKTKALDMVFFNAGISTAGVNEDGSAPLSVDGIEMVFATNLLGHHLMYKWLKPLVRKSKMSRIVLTSSGSSFRNRASDCYKIATDLDVLNSVRPKEDGHERYRQTKLGQILWAQELTEQLGANSTVYVNSFHPGVVNTPIFDKDEMIPAQAKKILDYFRKNVLWNATEASLTMLYAGVAVDEMVKKDIRGKYFHPVAHEVSNELANDDNLQKKLWSFLDDLVKDFVP